MERVSTRPTKKNYILEVRRIRLPLIIIIIIEIEWKHRRYAFPFFIVSGIYLRPDRCQGGATGRSRTGNPLFTKQAHCHCATVAKIRQSTRTHRQGHLR